MPSGDPDLRVVRELAVPTTADGTFGRLLLPTVLGGRWWYTMEDDWLDNRRGESCIPLGRYELERTIYHKKRAANDPWWAKFNYQTFEVTGVPNRTRILIHPANTEEDVEGCIGIGCVTGYKTVRDEDDPAHPLVRKRAVLQSKSAFIQFMAAMKGIDRWWLRVTGVVG